MLYFLNIFFKYCLDIFQTKNCVLCFMFLCFFFSCRKYDATSLILYFTSLKCELKWEVDRKNDEKNTININILKDSLIVNLELILKDLIKSFEQKIY
jgi:hypothetical protein